MAARAPVPASIAAAWACLAPPPAGKFVVPAHAARLAALLDDAGVFTAEDLTFALATPGADAFIDNVVGCLKLAGQGRFRAAAVVGGGVDGGGDGADNGSGGDGGARTSAARPYAEVSDAVGPLFQSEARATLSHCLAQVCPWAASRSDVITPFELSFGGSSRQADVFCYLAGDTRAPCASVPEAGVHVVWLDAARAEVTVPALAALTLDAGATFSPADPQRVGPQKYFVGEAYSGVARRADKVRQLETEVDFLCRRLVDRTGIVITDVTQVVGAAALVFSAAGPRGAAPPRAAQVSAALALVRTELATSPHLLRLAAAGRLLLVLLAKDQAPQTYHARDTSAALRALRDEQRSLAALIRERWPPVTE